mgnify:CR=1 FL=1
MNTESVDWALLSPEEKKKLLFLKQKNLLDTFLEKHAISQEQYDKSLELGFDDENVQEVIYV